MPTNQGIIFQERIDRSAPVLMNAMLNLRNPGELVLKFNETIDVTPQREFVFLQKIFLSNSMNNLSDTSLSLLGCSVVEIDSVTITIKLLESIRVKALERSGTPGGDSTPLKLDILSGSFVDLMMNGVTQAIGFKIDEIADDVQPDVLSVSLDFSTGVLTINMTETIDLTPIEKLELASIAILKDGQPVFSLGAGATLKELDTSSINIHLAETQRYEALRKSGTRGGDGNGPTSLNVLRDAMYDLADNGNIGRNVLIVEIEDSRRPIIQAITIDYNTGEISFSMDEFMDYRLVNASFITIANESNSTGLSLGGATVVSVEDSMVVVVRMTEAQRVFAILHSGTSGGDNSNIFVNIKEGALLDAAKNPVSSITFFNVTEIQDSIKPTLLSVIANFAEGLIKLKFSEAIDAIPNTPSGVKVPILLDKIEVRNTRSDTGGFNLRDGGRVYVEERNETVQIKISEVLRARIISLGGLKGGDGNACFITVLDGAVRDANNPNIEGTQQANEIPDTRGPNMEEVEIHLSNGTMIILADETVDATPSSQVYRNNMYLADKVGDRDVHLAGAKVVPIDSLYLTVILTETQRASAIKISGQAGGNGDAMFLNTRKYVPFLMRHKILHWNKQSK